MDVKTEPLGNCVARVLYSSQPLGRSWEFRR
jgi:hypothetical protein